MKNLLSKNGILYQKKETNYFIVGERICKCDFAEDWPDIYNDDFYGIVFFFFFFLNFCKRKLNSGILYLSEESELYPWQHPSQPWTPLGIWIIAMFFTQIHNS